MKKIFAAFAAVAIAASMFSFTGCVKNDNADDSNDNNTGITTPDTGDGSTGTGGDSSPDDGIGVDGLMQIMQNVEFDKLFGDCVNLGLRVDLEGEFNRGDAGSASGSIAADYKMSYNKISEEDFTLAGCGEATVKAEYGDEELSTIDLIGVMCHDLQHIYAYADGTAMGMNFDDEDKIKIDFMRVADYLSENGIFDTILSFFENCIFNGDNDDEGSSLLEYLPMIDEMGVKITADTSDGIDIKIVLTEETVWAAIDIIDQKVFAENEEFDFAAAMKDSLTVNEFRFDLYFAIDSDGAFECASIETDIDVEVKGGLFDLLTEKSGNPDVTASVKGCIEVYTHDKTVTVPEEIAESEDYCDFTENLLEMIDYYFDRNNENSGETGAQR